jgi:hypothetical protein
MAETHWKTHRGDEWFYSDHHLEASAGFNRVPPALVIADVRSRSTLTAEGLHSFLWRTHQQFHDSQIWLLLTRATRPLVESLAAVGHIRWEPIHNPLSTEARVLFVADPGMPPNNSSKPNPLRGSA